MRRYGGGAPPHVNPRSRRLDAARVDYALVARDLAVDAADIDEARAHRFGSDHAPLWLTLRP